MKLFLVVLQKTFIFLHLSKASFQEESEEEEKGATCHIRSSLSTHLLPSMYGSLFYIHSAECQMWCMRRCARSIVLLLQLILVKYGACESTGPRVNNRRGNQGGNEARLPRECQGDLWLPLWRMLFWLEVPAHQSFTVCGILPITWKQTILFLRSVFSLNSNHLKLCHL